MKINKICPEQTISQIKIKSSIPLKINILRSELMINNKLL